MAVQKLVANRIALPIFNILTSLSTKPPTLDFIMPYPPVTIPVLTDL